MRRYVSKTLQYSRKDTDVPLMSIKRRSNWFIKGYIALVTITSPFSHIDKLSPDKIFVQII